VKPEVLKTVITDRKQLATLLLSINQLKIARSRKDCGMEENSDEVDAGVNLPRDAVSIPAHGEAVRGLVPLLAE
jgi:hypothetical protein